MTRLQKAALTTVAMIAATTASNAADPIKIGVVTPLSGTYAGIGQQVRWGLELATKEVNAAGGIMERQIELLFEDEPLVVPAQDARVQVVGLEGA